MRKILRRLTGLALLGAGCVAATCSVYDESLVAGEAGKPGLEASTECKHLWVPEPPTTEDGSENVDFLSSLVTFDFGEPYAQVDLETGQYIVNEDGDVQNVPVRYTGLDQDKVCTANPQEFPSITSLDGPASCEPVANWFQPLSGDLPEGRDNGLRHVLQLVASRFPGFGTQYYRKNIQDGKVSLLLRVKDYNGGLNDKRVSLIVYVPGSFFDKGTNTEKPAFKGEDKWPVAAESFEGGNQDRPRLEGVGYVTNGTLVASFGDMDFRLRIGISPTALVDMRVQLYRVVVAGALSRDASINNRWRITEGQIVGRWRTQELLSSVKYFPNPDNQPGQPAMECMSAASYPFIRQYICQAADLAKDDVNPECDSISVGIGFQGVEATFGPVVDLPPLVNDCGNQDPAVDSCLHPYDPSLRADGPPPRPHEAATDGGT